MDKNNKLFAVLGVFALLAMGIKMSTYILTPGKQAIITRFGKPVKGPITKAGLHFKKPFSSEKYH